jgi:hypothetical protein
VIPHLTVAVGAEPFAELTEALMQQLPIAARIGEAWLLRRVAGHWLRLHRFPFKPTTRQRLSE